MTNDRVEPPIADVGVAFSGGGYRATLFALGSIIRLHELGVLPRVRQLSAVSGGALALGVLALNWDDLSAAVPGDRDVLKRSLLSPLFRLVQRVIDRPAILTGLLNPWSTVGLEVAKRYRSILFGDATLGGLSRRPLFVFYATSLQTGRSVRLTNRGIHDYRLGDYPLSRGDADLALADAVAASTAFPPFLAPVDLHLDPQRWRPGRYSDVSDPESLGLLRLADGGVYDNMGLEVHWQRLSPLLLVCDAGAPFATRGQPWSNWLSVHYRSTMIMVDQQRALRKRRLMEDYGAGKYRGAYWGIGSKTANFAAVDSSDAGPLWSDDAVSMGLRLIETRLRPIGEDSSLDVVDWGYNLADLSIRLRLPEISADGVPGELPSTWLRGEWKK